MPAPRRSSCRVRWRRTSPCPACRSPARPATGASSSMMSWPYSPRTRMRPVGPGSPIRMRRLRRGQLGRRAVGEVGHVAFAGVDHHEPDGAGGRRARACSGGTTVCSSDTSLPSVSPKPPGSRKSRCMSMTTSAVVAGSKSNGYGLGLDARVLLTGGCGAPWPGRGRHDRAVPSITAVEVATRRRRRPAWSPCAARRRGWPGRSRRCSRTGSGTRSRGRWPRASSCARRRRS